MAADSKLTDSERAETAGRYNFVHKSTGYLVAAGLSRPAVEEVAKRVAALGPESSVVELAADGNAEAQKLLRDLVDDARRAIAAQEFEPPSEPPAPTRPSEEAQRHAVATATKKRVSVALFSGKQEIFGNPDPLEAFKAAARRVHEAITTAPGAEGIVINPRGQRYLITRESRTARLLPPLDGGAVVQGGGGAHAAEHEARFLEAARAVEGASTPAEKRRAAANLRQIAQLIDQEIIPIYDTEPSVSRKAQQEATSRAAIVGERARTELDRRLAKDPQFLAMKTAFEEAEARGRQGDRKAAKAALTIGAAIDERMQLHVDAIAHEGPAPPPMKPTTSAWMADEKVKSMARHIRSAIVNAGSPGRGHTMVMKREPLRAVHRNEALVFVPAKIVSREGDFAVVSR